MQKYKCPICGHILSGQPEVCPVCGRKLKYYKEKPVVKAAAAAQAPVQVQAPAPQPEPVPDEVLNANSYYDGRVLPRLGWIILGFILTCLTVGFLFPVALYWNIRYEVKHMVINGKRLKFNASIAQAYWKIIGLILLSIITLGIYALFASYKITRWRLEHTVVEGEEEKSVFTGNVYQYIGLKLVNGVFTMFTIGLYGPVARAKQIIWEYSNSVFSKKKIVFTGNEYEYVGRNFLWTIFIILTLGIFALIKPTRQLKWEVSHCHFKA